MYVEYMEENGNQHGGSECWETRKWIFFFGEKEDLIDVCWTAHGIHGDEPRNRVTWHGVRRSCHGDLRRGQDPPKKDHLKTVNILLDEPRRNLF